MAKNSDKYVVLLRRKKELEHALEHDFPPVAVAHRADKVRDAAIAVIKKYDHRTRYWPGKDKRLNELREKWSQLSTDEIVLLVRRWRARPSMRDMSLR